MVSLFNHYMKFKGSHLTAFLKHEEFHYVLYMLYINKIREKKRINISTTKYNTKNGKYIKQLIYAL